MLSEYLAKVSHQEHMLLDQWLMDQWNVPDRADYQVMRVTQAVETFRQSFAKSPRAVTLEQCRVKFDTAGEQPEYQMSVEEATAISKAKWGRRRGNH